MGIVITDRRGTRRHYLKGHLHREDGPAVSHPIGYQRWYRNGKLHREDGPAVIVPNAYPAWYLRGKKVSMETVLDTPEKREAYLLEESLRRL